MTLTYAFRGIVDKARGAVVKKLGGKALTGRLELTGTAEDFERPVGRTFTVSGWAQLDDVPVLFQSEQGTQLTISQEPAPHDSWRIVKRLDCGRAVCSILGHVTKDWTAIRDVVITVHGKGLNKLGLRELCASARANLAYRSEHDAAVDGGLVTINQARAPTRVYGETDE